MTPALTVLQLDTQFPRIPGDVGCVSTYNEPVEVLRIPKACVGSIVSDQPDLIDIAPFAAGLAKAQGDIVVTSCGFLSFWQDHLAAQTNKTFISSALIAFKDLSRRYAPGEVMIVTFDAASLTQQHLGAFGAYADGIVGLPKTMHLRQVITHDHNALDDVRAGAELAAFVASKQRQHHKHILLECTNLPPYKKQLMSATGLEVSDILTLIEAAKPGLVHTAYL